MEPVNREVRAVEQAVLLTQRDSAQEEPLEHLAVSDNHPDHHPGLGALVGTDRNLARTAQLAQHLRIEIRHGPTSRASQDLRFSHGDDLESALAAD